MSETTKAHPDLKPLKLIAKDLEDLQILAAHLQDSLLPLISTHYNPKTHVFQALINRFCWEHIPHNESEIDTYFRTHSGLEIHHVNRILHKNMDINSDQRTHNLLTIHPDEDDALHLIFSGNAEMRLEIDKLHVILGDIDHPWPTQQKPTHIYEHVERIQASS